MFVLDVKCNIIKYRLSQAHRLPLHSSIIHGGKKNNTSLWHQYVVTFYSCLHNDSLSIIQPIQIAVQKTRTLHGENETKKNTTTKSEKRFTDCRLRFAHLLIVGKKRRTFQFVGFFVCCRHCQPFCCNNNYLCHTACCMNGNSNRGKKTDSSSLCQVRHPYFTPMIFRS